MSRPTFEQCLEKLVALILQDRSIRDAVEHMQRDHGFDRYKLEGAAMNHSDVLWWSAVYLATPRSVWGMYAADGIPLHQAIQEELSCL